MWYVPWMLNTGADWGLSIRSSLAIFLQFVCRANASLTAAFLLFLVSVLMSSLISVVIWNRCLPSCDLGRAILLRMSSIILGSWDIIVWELSSSCCSRFPRTGRPAGGGLWAIIPQCCFRLFPQIRLVRLIPACEVVSISFLFSHVPLPAV